MQTTPSTPPSLAACDDTEVETTAESTSSIAGAINWNAPHYFDLDVALGRGRLVVDVLYRAAADGCAAALWGPRR